MQWKNEADGCAVQILARLAVARLLAHGANAIAWIPRFVLCSASGHVLRTVLCTCRFAYVRSVAGSQVLMLARSVVVKNGCVVAAWVVLRECCWRWHRCSEGWWIFYLRQVRASMVVKICVDGGCCSGSREFTGWTWWSRRCWFVKAAMAAGAWKGETCSCEK